MQDAGGKAFAQRQQAQAALKEAGQWNKRGQTPGVLVLGDVLSEFRDALPVNRA
jgi:hypothetical protein